MRTKNNYKFLVVFNKNKIKTNIKTNKTDTHLYKNHQEKQKQRKTTKLEKSQITL